MTEEQHRGIAAGFIHVLQTSPATVAQWLKCDKSDPKAVGSLIQSTLNLAQPPDERDLQAMAKHAAANLQPQIAGVRDANAGAPNHVGFIFLAQQS